MAASRCTTCKKHRAEVIDDATRKPVCTGLLAEEVPERLAPIVKG
jgi:hypothetical protein